MTEQKSKKRRLFGLLRRREQIALTVCIVALLWFLLGGLKRKWERVASSKTKNQEKAMMHEQWKGKKSEVEGEFHNVIQHIMKQEKVDDKHLMKIVEEAARETKVRYEVDPPVTEKTGIFENHKTTVRLQDASMENLLTFDENIERDEANVRIDEMEIVGGRNGDMSTKATVSALDLSPEDDLLREVADLLETPELLQVYGESHGAQHLLNTYE
jgi:hypothetical protein